MVLSIVNGKLPFLASSKFESDSISVVPAYRIAYWYYQYKGIDTLAREGVILDENSTRTLSKKNVPYNCVYMRQLAETRQNWFIEIV